MESLLDRTYAAFAEQFGGRAVGITVAPGRLNIIGEHTDYNDGFVLPMAIDRYVAVAFEPTRSGAIEIWSEHVGEKATIPLTGLSRDGVPNWILYVSGMAWALNQAGSLTHGAGWSDGADGAHGADGITGIRLAVCSSLAVGAGVSSSAAFEIAVGTALSVAMDLDIRPREMAELALKSDHEFVGIPSGIMDQFASACCIQDHALLLDCRDRSFEHVPIGSETAFVVIDTGKRRELVTGEYAERVASCRRAVQVLQKAYPEIKSLRDSSREQLEDVKDALDDQTFRRARHVVSEMERPSRMVAAFAGKDWYTAGRLMYESHESLAADYDVSCSELDAAVEIASGHADCYGARLTGAGFGGCAIALCARQSIDDVVAYIQERYQRNFGKGMVYAVRASGGVRIV